MYWHSDSPGRSSGPPFALPWRPGPWRTPSPELLLYMYIHMYIHMCVYIYIYIYMYIERDIHMYHMFSCLYVCVVWYVSIAVSFWRTPSPEHLFALVGQLMETIDVMVCHKRRPKRNMSVSNTFHYYDLCCLFCVCVCRFWNAIAWGRPARHHVTHAHACRVMI